jgi:DNA-binding NtrC family response regulator
MSLEGRSIALIEDDPLMGESLVQSFSLEGCHVDWWRTGTEALRGLKTANADLVICDVRLPDLRGDDLFRQAAATIAVPPFLFITAYGDIDQAVEIMRSGAGDYMTKPFEMSAFMARVKALIHRHPVASSCPVLGLSDAMRDIEHTIRRIALNNSPVLITGETGSGKEVCARFLHSISPRSKEPFIAVNCAAIPTGVMERELFGSKPAAGHGYHRGFAERTRSGILFFDEVSELPVQLQAKLHRLVETREFHRLGGEQVVPFHGRIVCSTNTDLEVAIRAGTFRSDLYYRINVMCIDVPSLRRRREDIPWLMDLFFEQFRDAASSSLRGISALAYDVTQDYAWPGNVRELRNRIERAVALANGDWILPADMFPDAEMPVPIEEAVFSTLSETRDIAERRQIERALKQTAGQIIEAAKLLRVSRTTLWEKMRRLGISAGQN